MIGRDGFACLGRVTLADCALVPALFFLEAVLPGTGVADPIAANANVAAYWAAIRREEYAARILVELHRGLEERRELGYPPFTRLVRLEYRSLQADKAESAARTLAGKLRERIEAEKRRETDLIGPVPAYFSRMDGWYRWQFVPVPGDGLSKESFRMAWPRVSSAAEAKLQNASRNSAARVL